MALNRETHATQTVILTKELNEQLVKLAKDNHRSVSAQIAYIVEQYIKDSK